MSGAGMNLIKKKAPGRLSRAIVALAASTGKKLTWIRNNDRAPDAARGKEFNRAAEDFEGFMRLSERTTITVETERSLIVRRELK
jgi:hypothetical protein